MSGKVLRALASGARFIHVCLILVFVALPKNDPPNERVCFGVGVFFLNTLADVDADFGLMDSLGWGWGVF